MLDEQKENQNVKLFKPFKLSLIILKLPARQVCHVYLKYIGIMKERFFSIQALIFEPVLKI